MFNELDHAPVKAFWIVSRGRVASTSFEEATDFISIDLHTGRCRRITYKLLDRFSAIAMV